MSMTALNRLLFLILIILLTGCGSHYTQSPLVTKVFSGSNQKPDPILKQAMELDKDGVIKVHSVTRSLPPQIRATGPDRVLTCLSQPNGYWFQQKNECEFMNQQICKKTGGKYTDCVSACRHMTGDFICIQACVPVCSYSSGK